MPQTLEGTCPGFPIDNGCQVTLEARDPTTGLAVSGVVLTNINIYGLDLSGGGGPSLIGPFMIVPGPNAGG